MEVEPERTYLLKYKLEGLGLVDFEFETRADISQDERLAGGILAGGEYSKIEKHLEQYNYKKI